MHHAKRWSILEPERAGEVGPDSTCNEVLVTRTRFVGCDVIETDQA